MVNKIKIFVSAYACEPGLGSEIGVGWHWVLELSKYYELWVLTRMSNQHTIEPWIAEHPEYQCIHFLYWDLPKWARFWKKGLRGVRTYYNIWQGMTNSIVKKTMQEEGIATFMHITYGNVLWKVSSYGQKQHFIWGPVGGLETIPACYSQHYGTKWSLIEWTRRMVVKMLPLNIGFRQRCKNADLILCKTDVTRNLIPEQYRQKAVLQTDVATETLSLVEGRRSKVKGQREVTELITVGRLDAWRGFDLCIEAVRSAKELGAKVHLTIVGKGSDKERLVALIDKYGLQQEVTFTGKVDMERYKELMLQSDVVLNASLKEGAVTVSFDAMSMGKPIICLDTTGYTRYFNEEYAVIIPIGERQEVIGQIAQGIVRLTDSQEREKMGANALAAAQQFTWEERGLQVRDLLNAHGVF